MRIQAPKTLSLILLLLLFVNSCDAPANPDQPRVEEITAVTAAQVTVLSPTEDLTEASSPSEELDQAFGSFLRGMKNYNAIGISDLHMMLSQNPAPFLLDVRDLSEIEELGYIEGAVHIPLRQLASTSSIALLPSFETPLVIYCTSGWRSSIAMTVLGALGWKDALALKEGGVIGWVQSGNPLVKGLPQAIPQYAVQPNLRLLAIFNDMLSNLPDDKGGITPEAFIEEIRSNPNVILIDVRRTEELQATGHIQNSIHMPLENLIALQAKWPKEKDAKVLIYCSLGHRSTVAMTILRAYGYTNVRSLVGGIGS